MEFKLEKDGGYNHPTNIDHWDNEIFPSFNDFFRCSEGDYVRGLDSIIEELLSVQKFSDCFYQAILGVVRFKLTGRMDRLRDSRRSKVLPVFPSKEKQAVLNVYDRVETRLALELNRYLYSKRIGICDDFVLSAKQPIGFARIPNNLKKRAQKEFEPIFRKLELIPNAKSAESLKGKYDRVEYLQYKSKKDGHFFSMVREIGDKVGVFEFLKKETGFEYDISNIAVHLSRADDLHTKQTLGLQNKSKPSINLHIDPKFGIFKLLIYLNDVTQEEGAFSFIKGSHSANNNRIEICAAKAISVTNYMQNSEEIRALGLFPKEIISNAMFGDLLQDTEGEAIIKKEVFVESSSTGDLILFNPGQIAHRGGRPISGRERHALQVVLRPKIGRIFLPI